ncbi:MAG: tetratricopeptide repeat protein [Desulfobulbaceae bacterium]|nr:tetratricopeptide repeat protein [Desulfobulbaceae bacterium]
MKKISATRAAIGFALTAALFAPTGCGFKAEEATSSDYATRLLDKYQVSRAKDGFYSNIRMRSNLAQSHYRLGIFYLRRGQYPDAASAFSKAIETDINNIKAYNGLAVAYDGMGMYKAAQRVYGAAIARQPHKAYLHNNLGCSLLLQDDPAQALASFTRARQLDRENSRIRNNRALVLARSKAVPEPIFSDSPGEEGAGKSKTGEMVVKTDDSDKGISCLEEKKFFRVEIANGNGVRGIAGRSASYFRKKGIVVKHISNANHFNFSNSVVWYKEGFLREAYLIAAMIPGSQEMKKIDGDSDLRVDVKVILGHDVAQSGFIEMVAADNQANGSRIKVAHLSEKISSEASLN